MRLPSGSATRSLRWRLLTLSVITILGIVFAPWVISVLAPGFDPAKQALTVTLARIMYPFILLVSLAALVMGMLNARNVFGIPAMASSFFNLGSIVSGAALAWLFDPHFGPRALLGLALGTLVGGVLQLAVQLPALRREGFVFQAGSGMARSGCLGCPETDGAVGHRGEFDADQRDGQFSVRLAPWRRADLLVVRRLSPDATATGHIRRSAGNRVAAVAGASGRGRTSRGFSHRAGARYPPGVPHDRYRRRWV